ncbi:hypothetical protein ACNVED_05930 [Legionella sp. D16C41]|uniref:hypothetical protein n=1 Tax=Legionella sp. D16C41 TaxID=3402688 RepID=UPI003AF6C907
MQASTQFKNAYFMLITGFVDYSINSNQTNISKSAQPLKCKVKKTHNESHLAKTANITNS